MWLKNRGLRVTVDDVYIHALGYRIRVVRGRRLPQNIGMPTLLDRIGDNPMGLRPVVVRVDDPDPGRCLVYVRLDDALPLLVALAEKEEVRPE